MPRYLSASTFIMLWVCYLQLSNLSPELPRAQEPRQHISLAFPCFYSGTVGLMALQLQTLVLCLCRVSWEAAATGVRNTPTHAPLPPFLLLLISVYIRKNTHIVQQSRLQSFEYLINTIQKYMCMET